MMAPDLLFILSLSLTVNLPSSPKDQRHSFPESEPGTGWARGGWGRREARVGRGAGGMGAPGTWSPTSPDGFLHPCARPSPAVLE